MRKPVREIRVAGLLLAVAVVVSIVHYVDNTVDYDAYPQPTSGPAPSQPAIAVAWFAFLLSRWATTSCCGTGGSPRPPSA